MPSLSASPGISSQTNTGGVSWSGASVTLGDGQSSYIRNHAIGSLLNALHDGCIVTNIRVEFIASHGTDLAYNISANASFLGASAVASQLTTTSTLYGGNGGAGTAPSAIRAGTISVSASNFDGFHSATVSVTSVSVTITYIDAGLPGMLQFSL